MGLIERQPRSLTRETVKKYSDKIFIIGVEGRKDEPEYLGSLNPVEYLDSFNMMQVNVISLAPPDDKSAIEYIINELDEYRNKGKIFIDGRPAREISKNDEFWIMADVDRNLRNRKKLFLEKLQEAYDKKYNLAISNPCLEVWFILHFRDIKEDEFLKSAKEFKRLFGEEKNEVNKKCYGGREFYDYCMNHRLEEAIIRAEFIDSKNKEELWPENGGTRIYRLLKEISSIA